MLDKSKFLVSKPTDLNNIYGWERSIRNGKVQVECQVNQVLHMEVAEAKSSAVWLHYNKHVERMQQTLQEEKKQAQDEQNSVNLKRKMSQDAIVDELIRNKFQRQETLLKCWAMYKSCEDLESKY
jgi:Breast carcinoma amplified sequence 2 (BCAS2)